MPIRSCPLANGEIYHIFSKSISGFEIFRNDSECERMKDVLRYYKSEPRPLRFAVFLDIQDKEKFFKKHFAKEKQLIEIIAYCIMPTHIHLVLKQINQNGIAGFMQMILNSHTHYFNNKIKRKGPLWQARFQNVLVKTDEQLIHLTRYIHLNPVTAYLVNKPQDWKFSSYKEYLGETDQKDRLCDFSEILDIEPKDYQKFVNTQIDYQRELAHIQEVFIE